ncbi:hypothetical protein RRF57_005070 [Xylaria bambusicola]|uniref:Uncharacterized protein n=1 Tax=Xylaria bambusicola TaxID=326684 RepID=A0AAN7UBH1_9PEZI
MSHVGVVICSAIAFGFIPTKSCSPNFFEPGALPSCFQEDLEPGAPCCSRESNMGWRYFLYTLSAITLFVFFLRAIVFRLKESPKFLIYQDRDAEAVGVVQHIAKKNGRPCNLTLADFERLTGEGDSIGSGSTDSDRKAKQLALSRKEQIFAAINKYSVLLGGWRMANGETHDISLVDLYLRFRGIYGCSVFNGYTVFSFRNIFCNSFN